ncbi:protein G12-like [Anopheles albimanus]|uniref:protein G12-like n=1 Tax=Anopheles albimanus TaxID=7167 RepID=UPI00163F7BAD|nr:protein G12-like [Anopheles albimanus]
MLLLVSVTLLVLVTVDGGPIKENFLLDDFHDFIDVLPLDQLLKVTNQYYAKDEDFQEFLHYLQGEEFTVVWQGFFELPAIQDFLQYLASANVPVYDFLNLLADFIGQTSLQSAEQYSSGKALTRGGVKGFIEELSAIIPTEHLRMMYEEKMQNSSAFLQFMVKLRMLDYLQIQHFYTCSKELRSFVQVLRSFGVDIDHWENTIRAFLGWKRHI